MLTAEHIDRYHADGFLLLDVLDAPAAERLRQEIDRILLPAGRSPTTRRDFHSSENQHVGDELEAYGEKSKHYYFHLLTDERFLAMQSVFHLPGVLAASEDILGGPLIINNASLFAAEPGTCYNLGWHRDVIQIPEDEIDEQAIYAPARFHNSVQVNLALCPDETLWIVPGSHRRPNTPEERAAFQGSKHYAGIDARMPGGVNVRMRAGQAVLYNNNLIHRGYTPGFRNARRSLHMGYHCSRFPPTWHFYLLDEGMFTPAYRARMSSTVRAMIDAYFACRAQYPRMPDTWAFCRRPSAPQR